MNRMFEKILERLRRKVHNYYPSIDHYCLSEHAVKMSDIEKIVQEVAEEYNNGWIPCSERLPEYDEEYYKKNGTHRSYIVMEEKAYAPSVAYYTKDKLWFYDDMIEFKNVVAWQPLPEPYQPK